MRQADFPTPWHVIHNGLVVAEFDSQASAWLYVEVRLKPSALTAGLRHLGLTAAQPGADDGGQGKAEDEQAGEGNE